MHFLTGWGDASYSPASGEPLQKLLWHLHALREIPKKLLSMTIYSNVTGVIPVRAGSQRIKGKNLRLFSGLDADSLLSWKIKQLLQVLPAENILVSSDWDEALEVAACLGCKTQVRADWLCSEDAPFDEVIKAVANEVGTEHMMWSPVTSPFVGPSLVSEFLDKYFGLKPEQQSQGQILTSQLRDYFFMSGKPLNFPLGTGHIQTQDIAPISRWSWALSVRPTQDVITSKYMFNAYANFFDADILSTFDINDEIEFVMAQELIGLYTKREGTGK